MSTAGQTMEAPNAQQNAGKSPNAPVAKASVSRFASLEDEYVKAELHNGIVMFADIREFSSYMDANSDYAISLLACFRRVLLQHLSSESLEANIEGRYTTFAKELGDGMMMIWLAEQGSITDITTEEIASLTGIAQNIVKDFYELSADFAPEKYNVGIGIAVGSFQRLLYKDKTHPDRFRYRDYCGGTINMAARLQSLSRPNGVTVSVRSLPLNKKTQIEERLRQQNFQQLTQDVRGLGQMRVHQWKYDTGEQDPVAEG